MMIYHTTEIQRKFLKYYRRNKVREILPEAGFLLDFWCLFAYMQGFHKRERKAFSQNTFWPDEAVFKE